MSAAGLDSISGARQLDEKDPLRGFRKDFCFPTAGGKDPLYFAGHSLGLMPRKAKEYVEEELAAWAEHAVHGHIAGKHPWLPYHESVTPMLARLVGAKESEVIAMNSTTVNLHLALVSFYAPTQKRFKILIENNTFPSDRYAVQSQARFHGLDPAKAIVELRPLPGELAVREEDIVAQIEALGESLALVLLGNCNYLSGQCFDFQKIVEAGHSAGALVGFDLAHGAGNLFLSLHQWEVDFAVWCSYKYLNAGPGAVAGAFIHEKHHQRKDLPRFEGWWGHNKETRFKMLPAFDACPTAEAWQLSNPPILQLAALRASLELFDKATMSALREKGDALTDYLERLIKKHLWDRVQTVTPPAPRRGSMLSMRIKGMSRLEVETLGKRGVFVDFREPDIVRATPAPLYTSYEDVYRLVEVLKEAGRGR